MIPQQIPNFLLSDINSKNMERNKLNSTKTKEESADNQSMRTMYHNGDIITMEGDEANYAKVVLVQEGKIIYVGNKEIAINEYRNVNLHDLNGKTLIPGLIEPHLHPSLAAIFPILLKLKILAGL